MERGGLGGGGEVSGIVGVDFMVKLCPKIVVAVEFDAAACNFGGDQGEEVYYSLMWWCEGCTCDQCYLWKEVVKSLLE